MTLDFTSSLYLGLRHSSAALRPWDQFTTGKPAALEEPPVVRQVLGDLVSLIGCEAGVVGASTLHLAWDLMRLLSRHRIAVYLDDGTYPILRWSVERAACRGVPVRQFASHDAEALRRLVWRGADQRRIPVVVTDGSCPACGRITPLPEYLDSVRPFGGIILVDDTQALGILGSPRPGTPYGVGGGGSLRWHGVAGADLLVIASLAKGLGVPVAVLAGGRRMLTSFAAASETRVHCSPPSIAALHAALAALEANRAEGDERRRVLAARVDRFRHHLVRLELSGGRSLFPFQTLEAPRGDQAVSLHRRLANAGIRAVLLSGAARGGGGARLVFIVSASHSEAHIDSAAAALEAALRHEPISSQCGRRYVCQHDGPRAGPVDSLRPAGEPASAPRRPRLSAATR